MEQKFKWWFPKKNEPASDFEDYTNGYYGNNMSTEEKPVDAHNGYDSYSDSDISDVSVVLSGDPAKDEKEPLYKRTFIPTTCEDSADIVDAYKEGRVIVICIENLDKPNFLRLFDYVMGAVHALDGELKRIDRDTVVLFPYDVDSELSVDDIEEEKVDENEAGDDSEDLD